jgi:hypothetical protein
LVTSSDGRGGSGLLPDIPGAAGSGSLGGSADSDGGTTLDPDDANTEEPETTDDATGYADAAPSNDVAPDGAPAPEPILHYKFDETTGNVVSDSSGNAHPGTANGTHAFAPGVIGNALTFDGATAFVAAPSGVVSTLTSITIATWVEVDASTSWQRILDFGNSSTVYMLLTPRSSTTGTLRFAITVGGTTGEQILDGSSALPTGVWKHVAVVLDGQKAALYVDGVLESFKSSFTLRPIDLGATRNNWLGRSEYAVDPYFKGKLDDFRIYASALSAEQVAAIAHP